jgi:hypothetical protein
VNVKKKMESDEIKVRRVRRSIEAHMSSYASNDQKSDPSLSAVSMAKRKRRFLLSPVLTLALWFILIHCWSSSFHSSLVLASPVEEDPQSYDSGATGGLSFSINSPRKNEGNRRKENDDRGQKPVGSVDDRKRIKVMSKNVAAVLYDKK